MILKFPLRRQPEKFVVGNAAPQEKRESRRQFQIADAVFGSGGDTTRIALNAEKKLWRNQEPLKRHLDAGFKVSFRPAVSINIYERINILIRNGPAVRSTREVREYLSRAGFLLIGAGWFANENGMAAWSIRCTSWIVRSNQCDAADGGLIDIV